MSTTLDPDMLAEYEFEGGERGKFAADYAHGTNIIILEPELMDVFPDSESVNAALRPLANLIRSRTLSTAPSAKT
ncbi:MAG TPA: hypothetical protein VGM51_00790 [Armatimonadota bacterium]|jgi:hypothetical protein